MNLKKNVLDKGFIEVVDHLGTDLTVVNSARVSFGKRKTTYTEADRILVRFLAENKHFSPFRHLIVQFHIKAPEFVMRQWYKHVVGIETT
ncbi:MAG: thymidylate synthase (FAD), partial [Ignavibacteria bacterium]|nr:thymidylate synthase (FAD) [Ignavibacteria bacterium]